MSLEDDIFDVEAALKGTPEERNFKRLQPFIAGSKLLEESSMLIDQLADAHMRNHTKVSLDNTITGTKTTWIDQDSEDFYKRLKQLVAGLRGES